MVCVGCKTPLESGDRFCPTCGAPVPARASSLARPGARLDLGWGQVIVGDKIGDGGMGVVYRGWLYHNPAGFHSHVPPHPVAVKALHPTMTSREHIRKLFVGEATALKSLNHPNVVHFFAFVEAPGQLAIVIEFVDGEALDAVIARRAAAAIAGREPCLTFARAWHYFEQLLGALAATHELDIVHRDVKPANLLIRRDGLAKLTDFGIAQLPADEAQRFGGVQPGTGAYMSPEQVAGWPLDGRSDLYSAAIVLYEALTGRTPFDDGEKSELMVRKSQMDDTPPPITGFLPGAPPIMDMLFARALAKNPDNRFANAIELGNAFSSALGLPDTPGWRAQREFAKRATGMVPAEMLSPRKIGRTIPIAQVDANAMRCKLASVYTD